MSATGLLEPVLAGGIRSVNFFNGRLLSGEDLTAEQLAQRTARERLGQAIGQGIVRGFEVALAAATSRPEAPVVTVQPGLALDGDGRGLALGTMTDVSLVHQPGEQPAAAGTNGFAACVPPEDGAFVTGAGIYLLVVAPGGGTEGRAPVSGLGNIPASCNTRWLIEGVKFRRLQLPGVTLAELADTARLQNLVAHRCFGTEALAAMSADPLGAPLVGWGVVDLLRSSGKLASCEIPIAVLGWTARDGITFVDDWAVRRRPVVPALPTAPWTALVGARRMAEAEALRAQFQEHLESLRRSVTNPETVLATDRFRWLPPAGLLPISRDGGPTGFDGDAFFGGLGRGDPMFLEAAQLEPLLRRAVAYPPIDLTTSPMVHRYVIRENVDAGAGTQAVCVFTSGDVPIAGGARYDVAHWDEANYA